MLDIIPLYVLPLTTYCTPRLGTMALSPLHVYWDAFQDMLDMIANWMCSPMLVSKASTSCNNSYNTMGTSLNQFVTNCNHSTWACYASKCSSHHNKALWDPHSPFSRSKARRQEVQFDCQHLEEMLHNTTTPWQLEVRKPTKCTTNSLPHCRYGVGPKVEIGGKGGSRTIALNVNMY